MRVIELTERLLADAGGWQALKEARGLHQMGRISEASWEPPLLKGTVRAGETEYRAGLRVLGRSNVENLCTCRDARQRGLICAHSLAVGLEVLNPRRVSKPLPQPVAKVAPSPPAAPLTFSEHGELLEVAVVLAPNFAANWGKGSITVGLEALWGGKRTLLPAVDPARSYRVSATDRELIEQVSRANGGTLPGMMLLPRLHFVALLEALSGHPRVTFGRGTAIEVEGSAAAADLVVPPEALRLDELTGRWFLHGTRFARLPEVQKTAAPATKDSVKASSEGGSLTFALKIEGSLNFLAAELESHAANQRITITSPDASHPAERAAVNRLLAMGFTAPGRDGKFVLRGEPQILRFFASELPRLQKEWAVTIGARFEHVTSTIERVTPRFEIRSSGETWFDLNLELSTESGERFSAAEIQRLLRSGQRSVRLKNQKLAVFDTALLSEFDEVLKDCNPQQLQPGRYRIGQEHAAYLQSFGDEGLADIHAHPDWRQRSAENRGLFGERAPLQLGSLEDVLRPYQREGVVWMQTLAQQGFGGILSDEMGLGKTLQVLAFLRTSKLRALIVCPSSLVFNWQREIARFTPELQATAVVGSDRAGLISGAADVLITSYALLRRDAALYQGCKLDAVILDEAQHIKNPESQNAQSASSVSARHRFALTGTPIENSITDLWSLMHFLMPGYLGAREDFRERYEKEITTEPGGPAHQRLRKRMKPFMLRRLKADVIQDLPDKLEQVAYCELSAQQQELYTSLALSIRRNLSELSGSKTRAKARMTMLTGLLRLRQTCCDIRLLNPESESGETSGKVELLRELLSEAIDGNHRVLVFSQFATMLRLLQTALDEMEIPYCHLDGKTKDRAAQVDRFQAGDASVFLISLKAGGTGLNLTAADTVIHFDPWWNPAIEAQATDRAHRIGQKKVVTSYKLITRNTVEEKILALQSRKRTLISATLEDDDNPTAMTGLTDEEVEELLAV